MKHGDLQDVISFSNPRRRAQGYPEPLKQELVIIIRLVHVHDNPVRDVIEPSLPATSPVSVVNREIPDLPPDPTW